MSFNKETSAKKRKAFELRLRGESYGQIIKKLGLSSKGTLSSWFRDLHLPQSSLIKLEKNKERAWKRGLTAFNKERSLRIRLENEAALLDTKSKIRSLNKRELMLVGGSLYWAEGSKLMSKQSPYLAFSNSDPAMMALYMRYMREILLVSDEQMKAHINLYPGNDVELAKQYWSRVMKLPPSGFKAYKLVSRSSMGKKKWTRLPHGTAQVRVHKRLLFYRTMGIIEGLKIVSDMA